MNLAPAVVTQDVNWRLTREQLGEDLMLSIFDFVDSRLFPPMKSVRFGRLEPNSQPVCLFRHLSLLMYSDLSWLESSPSLPLFLHGELTMNQLLGLQCRPMHLSSHHDITVYVEKNYRRLVPLTDCDPNSNHVAVPHGQNQVWFSRGQWSITLVIDYPEEFDDDWHILLESVIHMCKQHAKHCQPTKSKMVMRTAFPNNQSLQCFESFVTSCYGSQTKEWPSSLCLMLYLDSNNIATETPVLHFASRVVSHLASLSLVNPTAGCNLFYSVLDRAARMKHLEFVISSELTHDEQMAVLHFVRQLTYSKHFTESLIKHLSFSQFLSLCSSEWLYSPLQPPGSLIVNERAAGPVLAPRVRSRRDTDLIVKQLVSNVTFVQTIVHCTQILGARSININSLSTLDTEHLIDRVSLNGALTRVRFTNSLPRSIQRLLNNERLCCSFFVELSVLLQHREAILQSKTPLLLLSVINNWTSTSIDLVTHLLDTSRDQFSSHKTGFMLASTNRLAQIQIKDSRALMIALLYPQ